jgi:Tol biopolymer transport system component/DNA-binding winged helix-turn-helix (wHTH) protein
VLEIEQPSNAAASNGHTDLWIGDWQIDPQANELKQNGRVLRLEPRAMQTLLCLAENAGRPVTRDELLARAWPDCTVNDDSLSTAISKLRKAFADDSKEPKFIETVPKVGYRLVAAVHRTPPPSQTINLQAATQTPVPTAVAEPVAPSFKRLAPATLILLVFLVCATFAGWRWMKLRRSNDAPVGKTAVPITSFPGIEISPAFSPGTGDRVAFSWRGKQQDNWDIYVQVVGAGNPLRLTEHAAVDVNPAWSPDGRFVAFSRFEKGKCEIREVPALGGAEVKLADCEFNEVPALAWSPDGKWLAWPDRAQAGEPFRIVLFELESSQKRVLTAPPAGSLGDLDVAFAPDSQSLAFLRSPVPGVEDAWIVKLAGGEPRRVTTDNVKVHGVDWTPDGRHLVYASNRGGLFSLWRSSVTESSESREPQSLGTGGGNTDAPSVAPDGKRIAYELWQDEANIYRLDLKQPSDAQATKLLFSTRWDWNPAYSPDGARIAFVSDRRGSSEIWMADKDGGNLVQRTSFGGPLVTAPQWSPDSGQIVFDARVDGNADLWLIEPDSARPRRLTTAAAEEIAPSFSRDGRWVYFGSNANGSWQVWKLPAAGGDAIQVTQTGGLVARESADGRLLYFTRRDQSGLWRMPAAGGAETRVLDTLNPVDRDNWLVTAEAIYFISRPTLEAATLTRFDLATRRMTALTRLDRFFFRSGLTLAPDQRSLLFARIDRWESDIMMIEQRLPN